MKNKFISKPYRKVSFYKTGKIYNLTIKIERFGFLWINERPVIVSPRICPYSNWETFYQNWQEVRRI